MENVAFYRCMINHSQIYKTLTIFNANKQHVIPYLHPKTVVASDTPSIVEPITTTVYSGKIKFENKAN